MTRRPGRSARLAHVREVINNAAFDPDGWSEALAAVTRWSEADAAVAYLPTLQPGRGFSADHILFNMPDASEAAAISAASGRLDAWTEVGLQRRLLRPGFMGSCRDFLNDRQFEENPWSHTYFESAKLRRYMGFLSDAPVAGAAAMGVSFFRRTGARPFCESALAQLSDVRDDLERAGRWNFRLRAQRADAEAAKALLSASVDAMFVVAATGAVEPANLAAEGLLRDGQWLMLANGGLALGPHAAPDPAGVARLLCALSEGRSAELVIYEPSRTSKRPRWIVHAAPSSAGAGGALGVLMACWIGGPGPGLAERLRRLFKLTPAEADIAIALANQASLDAIAAQRRANKLTVETQKKSIYKKMGVSKQTDFVRAMDAVARRPCATDE